MAPCSVIVSTSFLPHLWHTFNSVLNGWEAHPASTQLTQFLIQFILYLLFLGVFLTSAITVRTITRATIPILRAPVVITIVDHMHEGIIAQLFTTYWRILPLKSTVTYLTNKHSDILLTG